jgi:hypothetical protein
MSKTWLHIILLNLLIAGIVTKLRVAIKTHIPLGYQDEAGFHFGVQQPHEDQ